MKEKISKLFQPMRLRHDLIIKNLKNGIILDLSSADFTVGGNLHKALKERITNKNYKLIGVDIVKNENVDITANLNKKFPFPDDYADNIVAGDILEHMENPFYFLQECKRVLKKGGNLLIITPNMMSLAYFLKPDFSQYREADPHLYSWNIPILKTLIEKSDLKINQIFYFNAHWGRNLFKRFLCFLIKRWGSYIFVEATK